MDQVVRISNDEEAWYLLKELIAGVELPYGFEINFEKWPSMNLRFSGVGWNSTLPTRLMPPIMDLQKEIYSLYAKVCYGVSDGKRLSDEERRQLELFVKVEPGSSVLEIIMDAAFQRLSGVLSTMNANHVVVLMVSLAILYGTDSMQKAWLEDRRLERDVQAQQFARQEDTERMRMMYDFARGNNDLERMIKQSDKINSKLIRAVGQDDTLEIADVKLDRRLSRELTTTARETAQEIRVDGVFRIMQVDASAVDGFKVKVKRISDDMEVITFIPNNFLSMAQIEMLRNSEWERQTVSLTINAKELRGEVKSAKIVNVFDVPGGEVQ